ncbi:hypothetical protein Q7P37_000055 [Cladosporium fusiforme]
MAAPNVPSNSPSSQEISSKSTGNDHEATSSSASSVPQLTDQTHYVKPSKIIMVFLTCSSVDFVALMDQTTLAASLQIVSRALGAGSQSAWIAGAYFLTSTSFQLLYGRLSDIFSRKTVLLSCIFIFFIGALAASLAKTATQMIAFRALTGVGGGGLMTLAQTIVSDVVSLRDRGKYQGILGAVVAIANGIGPIIGASLSSIDSDSWRWMFRMNLPLTAMSTVAVLYFMPLKPVEGSWLQKIKLVDFFGCGLTLAASTLIVLSLTWADTDHPWNSPAVIAPLVLGIATLGAFVLWQWKGPQIPLMPLHIFRSGLVVGACLTMFINGWLFVTQVYYLPSFFQLAYGLSAVKSGALLLPITLTQTVSSTLSGLIVHWTGRYRESIIFGWVAWAVGLGMYSTLDTERFDVGKAIGYGLLTGFGVGQTLQPSLIAIQAGVARQDMAVVTCTRNFVRNLGSTLGLAISATLVNSSLRSALSGIGVQSAQFIDDPTTALSKVSDSNQRSMIESVTVEAYAAGFRRMFYLNAALAAFACILAICLIPQIGLDRPDDDALREKSDVDEKKSCKA